MKVFLAAVILVAFCVAVMCVGILFGRTEKEGYQLLQA